ncbi:hypothetical protein [Phormidium sp. CCY1219]|uniref:hypothetical protein n=1 Tax=Phormidium sp. CCY1219 TaxID=2886104 RepID=UPI002D1E7AD5|nr:hypothetical protein [Phormidium sp. CCY1219]MEB3831889.1 hypothetical protein [Phormidium sp. CCY1219]
METKPTAPIIEWLIEEQGGLEGKEVSEVAGISPVTWSKIRQGKQNPTGDTIWRVMCAIAALRPRSACAEVVQIIKGEKRQPPSLANIIEASTEEELEAIMKLIIKRLFSEKRIQMVIN